MPSFIPRNQSMQQMAGISPDYLASNTCGMQYLPPPPPYSAHQTATLRSDNITHGYVDHYRQQPAPPPPYPQQNAYLNPPPGLPIPSTMVGAPRLPPIQTYVPSSSREPTFLPEPAPNPNEEKAVGGVSARLDYDLEMMADFVTNTSHNLVVKYLNRKQAIVSVPSVGYHKWVLQVLSATRLPSSTIFLSLYYLSKRVAALGTRFETQLNEYDINKILTVSLIIGSKFFDDNTFINKSWAEVSGLDVKLLNEMEREWLLSIAYHLHLDEEATTSCSRLRKVWDDHVVEQNRERAAQAMKLSPVDTSFRHASPHLSAAANNRLGYEQKRDYSNFGTQVQPAYYPASATTQYNSPWNHADDSPASAPHTGPTTPEYYGAAATWIPDRSFSYDRRTMFYGRQVPQQQPTFGNGSAYHGSDLSPLHNNNYGWSTHGLMCNCSFCAGGRNVPYYNWAPQVVA